MGRCRHKKEAKNEDSLHGTRNPSTSTGEFSSDRAKSTKDHLPVRTLSYKKAKAFLGDPYIKEVVEVRHVTLGWQHASNVATVLRNEVMQSIGRYVASIHAIPIAIGTISIQRSIYIIEDQDCMHLDVHIKMIAFDCNEKCDRPLKCKAMLISDKTVVGQLYGIITVVNGTPIPHLRKGDDFYASFVDVQFNDNLCQLLTRTGNDPSRVSKRRSKHDL